MQRAQESYQCLSLQSFLPMRHFTYFLQARKNLLESPQWITLIFSIIPTKQAITSTRRIDLIALN